ncbi:MAG: hypothetical protein IJL91_05745 [Bacteroidales bacterium]|nr:hypothetical protein [Bacteroidales bacterium]
MTCCMTASLSRVGSVSSSATLIDGGISSLVSSVGGDLHSSAEHVGRMSCSMYQVCRTSVAMHYLEISPKIVWMLAGHTENDVYSNTRWFID